MSSGSNSFGSPVKLGWAEDANYEIGDLVISSGAMYIANTANKNDEPPSSNWDLYPVAGAAVPTVDVTIVETMSVGDPVGYGNGEYGKVGIEALDGDVATDLMTTQDIVFDAIPMSGVTGGIFLICQTLSGTGTPDIAYRFLQWDGTDIVGLSTRATLGASNVTDAQCIELSDDHFLVVYDIGAATYGELVDYNGGTPSVVVTQTLLDTGGAAINQISLARSTVDPDKAVACLSEGTTITLIDIEWDGSTTLSSNVNDAHTDLNITNGRAGICNMGPTKNDATLEMIVVFYEGATDETYGGMWLWDSTLDALTESLRFNSLSADAASATSKFAFKLDESHAVELTNTQPKSDNNWRIVEVQQMPHEDLYEVREVQSGVAKGADTWWMVGHLQVMGGGYFAILSPSGDAANENIVRVLIYYFDGVQATLIGTASFPTTTDFGSDASRFGKLVYTGETLIALWVEGTAPNDNTNAAPVTFSKYVGLLETAVSSPPETGTVRVGGIATLSGLNPGNQYSIDHQNQEVSDLGGPIKVGRAITATKLAMP